MSNTTNFGLLRHAETVWNRQKRIQGRKDSPLTEAGIDTCRRWGRFLASSRWSWNRIICSPSPRARESARIINKQLGVDIEIAEDLREQDWGTWEGLTMAEVSKNLSGGLKQLELSGWNFKPPSGESRLEVRKRVCAALKRYGKTYNREQILVISHQGVIKSLIYAIENRQFLPDEPNLIKKNRLHTIALSNNLFSAGRYNIDNRDLPEPM